MAKLTLPKAEEALGTCPHCGAKVVIAKTWLQKLNEIIKSLNTLNETAEDLDTRVDALETP